MRYLEDILLVRHVNRSSAAHSGPNSVSRKFRVLMKLAHSSFGKPKLNKVRFCYDPFITIFDIVFNKFSRKLFLKISLKLYLCKPTLCIFSTLYFEKLL